VLSGPNGTLSISPASAITGAVTLPNSAPLLGSNTGGNGVAVTPTGGLALNSNFLSPVYGTGAGTVAQGNDSRIVGALPAAGGTPMTGPLELAWNPALSGNVTSSQQPFSIFSYHSGTVTDPNSRALNSITIAGDQVNGTPAVHGLDVIHHYGGSAMTGRRIALYALASMNVALAPGAGTFMTGAELGILVSANAGGTGLLLSNSAGNLTGANPVAGVLSGGTNITAACGVEVDLAIAAGGSTRRNIVALLDTLSNHAVQGSAGLDAFLIFTTQTGSTAPMVFGAQFGDQEAPWPFDTANPYAALIYVVDGLNPFTYPPTIAWGIDMLQLQATYGVFRAPGFCLNPGGASGTIQLGTGYFSAQSNGIAIDAKGQIVTGAAVAAAGTGYLATNIMVDTFGGIYKVLTVSSGGVATVQIMQAPVSTSPPSNPVPTRCITPVQTSTQDYPSGCTLNLNWSASSTALALNPSGGPMSIGGITARLGMASSTPSTGGTVSIGAGISDYRILGGSTLAALTVKLPGTPSNGQTVKVTSQVAITALTVQDSAGSTSDIQTPPSSLAAGAGFSAQWNNAATAWWCDV
jgi:hypothetical protein